MLLAEYNFEQQFNEQQRHWTCRPCCSIRDILQSK